MTEEGKGERRPAENFTDRPGRRKRKGGRGREGRLKTSTAGLEDGRGRGEGGEKAG